MNTCVCCGEPIPEGRQVCRNCEAESYVEQAQVSIHQQAKEENEATAV